jgi:dUTP pyrophosphatase
MEVKVKRLDPAAKLPAFGTELSAGMDLSALEECIIGPHEVKRVATGIALEMPRAVHGHIYSRSSLASHGIIALTGVIDSDYRGHVQVMMLNSTEDTVLLQAGDRIAQLVLQLSVNGSDVQLVEVDQLSKTARGGGGFGSTGR